MTSILQIEKASTLLNEQKIADNAFINDIRNTIWFKQCIENALLQCKHHSVPEAIKRGSYHTSFDVNVSQFPRWIMVGSEHIRNLLVSEISNAINIQMKPLGYNTKTELKNNDLSINVSWY